MTNTARPPGFEISIRRKRSKSGKDIFQVGAPADRSPGQTGPSSPERSGPQTDLGAAQFAVPGAENGYPQITEK